MPDSAAVHVPGVFRYYGGYLRPHARKLLGAGGFLLVATLMNLARPWPLKVVFDYVLLGQKPDPQSVFAFLSGWQPSSILLAACAAILVITVLYGWFDYTQSVVAAKVGQKVVYSVRERLYYHVQRLSLGFHTRSKSGDLLSRMIKDVNQLRDFLADSAVQLAAETVFVVGMVLVMLALDWQLTLLCLVLVPLLFYSISHFTGEIRGLTRKRLEREGKVASMFNETLAAVQEIQLFAGDKDEDDRFQKENKRSYRAEMRALRTKSKLLRIVEMLSAVATCLVLWWGARQVLRGVLTPGDLLVFLTYLKSMYKPVRRIASLSVQASKSVVAAERVMEILKTEPEVRDLPGAVAAPRFTGEVEFRNVTFAYRGGPPALRNVSFHVEAGQTVAIVGASGAGKSTLISLIPRLYDPTDGAVCIGGVDIRKFTLQSLREQISVVPQDPVLFGTSVRENIAFGNLRANRQAIRLAARLACAEEFIEQLPKGYDTVIAERGATLSGGQRQRIAIARALLRETPIVILDEPMTGLDTESETSILQGLSNLFRQKTAFVIAHRLSTMLDADVVLVIEDGRIAETGSPQQLYRAGGLFRRLSELQFGASAEEKFGHVTGWGRLQ